MHSTQHHQPQQNGKYGGGVQQQQQVNYASFRRQNLTSPTPNMVQQNQSGRGHNGYVENYTLQNNYGATTAGSVLHQRQPQHQQQMIRFSSTARNVPLSMANYQAHVEQYAVNVAPSQVQNYFTQPPPTSSSGLLGAGGGLHFIDHQLPLASSNAIVNGAETVVRTVRKYAQVLLEYCNKYNLGDPVYERSIIPQKDGGGRTFLSYNYSITVPALVHNYGNFHWTKTFPSDEEARDAAARFVFLQLGIAV